ncbi:fasciclin domain-containing protein [Pontibacter fetidus]|uniref:Fasciclin domain-containing protein n=1 Tax=Pontibacter fetidus TaxID=2700082 RepID=A0A6B2GVX5_9BACT|nr:fasciclin domain-containing protein [Pontibacter fetidus]NDK55079.1 fasciclin domain-containing protein [Pontibacter fetidus]
MLMFCSFSVLSCASSDNPTSETTTSTSAADSATHNANPTLQASTEDAHRDSTDNNVSSAMNLFALIRKNPNLSTLTELIVAADMIVVLESPANYTFFAPTNEAFAALPAGTLEGLKQRGNKFELTNLLQSHIIPKRVASSEMKNNMKLQTAHNGEVTVERNGNALKVGGANVITMDVGASNGIVHVIDKVLLPPNK